MFIINKDPRFFALNKNNEFKEFKNREELLRWLYNQAVVVKRDCLFYYRDEPNIASCKSFTRRIGHNFNDTVPDDNFWFVKKNPVDFVVYDAYFRVVSVPELKKELIDFCKNANLLRDKWRKAGRRHWNFKNLEHHRFRREPVPGVHNSHWHFRNSYKRMRCANEKKAFYSALESEIRPRARRSPSNLPDPWEDKPRSDCFIKRSWKKVKKRKQWM